MTNLNSLANLSHGRPVYRSAKPDSLSSLLVDELNGETNVIEKPKYVSIMRILKPRKAKAAALALASNADAIGE